MTTTVTWVRRGMLLTMFFFLGLGVFYNASKFHIPWYGNNDFAEYAPMVEHPFANATQSPFAYRVFTPTIAHYVYQSGLYYRSGATPFQDKFSTYNGRQYDAGVLAALTFTNFIFFVFAAFFLAETIGVMLPAGPLTSAAMLLVPSLLFLSFSTIAQGVAGLTEGGSLCLISLLLFLFEKRWSLAFALLVCASPLQRELIPLVMLVYLACRRANWRYLVFCAVAFCLYLLIKRMVPIPGYEGQTQATSQLRNLIHFRLTKEFALQALLSNNIIYVALLFLVWSRRSLSSLKQLLPFFTTCGFLVVLGIGSGIGNNVGRILNLALPMLLLNMVESVKGTTSVPMKRI